uniref:Uncharacterized protein n=1 Tax=Tanacetum cinerariifolium TaxID=118510 RepID=A0A6L2N531_TANCI|nr:hypothetical protein [Tanacetum cinerariifolium]
MDPNSSLGKFFLGENVVEISSDKVEGSGHWNSLEFQDTANSGQKKEMKGMVFHKMDTEEVSNRFVAPCFVNDLEAYDGETNLGVEENMISNEYVVKLYLEHEVKRGNKLVKKELIIALRGTSSLAGGHVTQEEVVLEALVIRISQKFALLEEVRPGKVNEKALADTESDMNTMPYRIYETLRREEIKKVDRGIKLTFCVRYKGLKIKQKRKFKFICHRTNSFKDFEWSNVPRVKLSLFSKSDNTFLSLQALSNLHYFRGGFMNYFWSWMKCVDLVRRSIMTQIVSCPLDVLGSFMMKSIVIFSQFHATNRVSLDPDTSCQNLGEWNILIMGFTHDQVSQITKELVALDPDTSCQNLGQHEVLDYHLSAQEIIRY